MSQDTVKSRSIETGLKKDGTPDIRTKIGKAIAAKFPISSSVNSLK
jgi:hypothetical protein